MVPKMTATDTMSLWTLDALRRQVRLETKHSGGIIRVMMMLPDVDTEDTSTEASWGYSQEQDNDVSKLEIYHTPLVVEN